MKKTLPQLKKHLTKVFNRYIRLRDCTTGYGFCISCKKKLELKQAHAGHYINSTYSPVRFDEMNVNLQCVGCNTFKHGNVLEYREAMIEKYGESTVKKLETKRHDEWKWDRTWLEDKIQYYKQKVNEFES